MRILIAFARAYPWQSLIMATALLLSGVVEGLGLSALLPLLALASGEDAFGGKSIAIKRTVHQALNYFGLSPSIGTLLAIVLVAIALKSFLLMAANKQVGYMVARITTDLRLAMLRAILVTRWEYFVRQRVGKLANAFGSEANRASQAFLGGARMTANCVQTIVSAALALLVSWKATLAALFGGVFILFTLRRLVQRARGAGRRQTEATNTLISRLTDSFLSIKPLKSMAREYLADAVLVRETTRLNRALEKQVFAKEALRGFQEPALTSFLLLGLYVAMVRWRMPLSDLLMLVFLLARVLSQLGKIQVQYQEMGTFEAAYWSVQETIVEAEEEKETALGSKTPSLVDSIHLERVVFAYEDRPVLRDVSITFPAGSFTAIVGPSGVGKTTVVDLVIGLLRPAKGEVLVDAVPLAEIDLRSWRRMIGYVPQETLLLHDTIFINVTLGDRDLTAEDVEQALRSAGAWDFVAEMPDGMNTTVGERGSALSGGQRQRIAIARALVHKPKLLILDEATTALDPVTEAAICATLRDLRGQLTILAISHQPAILEAADRAYRLQDGVATLVADRADRCLPAEKGQGGSQVAMQPQPIKVG
ncbi:MAG TPA: ABC transporter ATP-binding protein [Syntrophobacteria bacterium]|nr:ABC transporter ATP-binding protein [Syntrophobacteria bacterium]